jgi:predicted ABC-class ATPase
MPDRQDLQHTLNKLDGAPYPAYQDLARTYDFPHFRLTFTRFQRDPFAHPSQITLTISHTISQFPLPLRQSPAQCLGLRDYLARCVAREADHLSQNLGLGNSGRIQSAPLGQEVLDRTVVIHHAEQWEVRLSVGLPARGRRIAGRSVIALLCEQLPQLVDRCFLAASHNPGAIAAYCQSVEDTIALRQQLTTKGLVAFVADGAQLPRRSGIDPRPLQDQSVVPFQSPPSLRVTLTCPHRGAVTGMGIPPGITVIVGGGYHGKSTLLGAIALGVYDHPLGDGREGVVTLPTATKIRAEEGRSIAGVNISPFINHLPQGKVTHHFSTANASGSTSQAANIMEALEAGAQLLLLDEDTCATNFLIRDRRMQQLIPPAQEPITPLIDKIRQLYTEKGVSSILVMGGSGDYFEVADTVIALQNYHVRDVTTEAKAIAQQYPSQRQWQGGDQFGELSHRSPIASSLDPSRGKKAVSVKARSRHQLSFGQTDIDLAAIEQLVETNQTRAIGLALVILQQQLRHPAPHQPSTIAELLGRIDRQLQTNGISYLSDYAGDLAQFRPLELAAALNRLRGLVVAMPGLK